MSEQPTKRKAKDAERAKETDPRPTGHRDGVAVPVPDAVLLCIEKKVDEITTSLADKVFKADVDAVSDGLQDLRRDLRRGPLARVVELKL